MKAHQHTIVFGRHPVREWLRAGKPAEKLYIREDLRTSWLGELEHLARQAGVPVQRVPAERLQRLTGTHRHQGVALLAGLVSYWELDKLLENAFAREPTPLLLVLDQLEDPQNLGAILRTAEAAGVSGVIVPRHGSAPIAGAVLKSSAGAAAHLPIARVTNLVRALATLREAGFWIVGAEAEAQTCLWELDYADPIAFVIGSEGHGIRPLVRQHCDWLVHIPMQGRVGSLNASVAAGVLVYTALEARWRRARSGPEAPRP